LNPRTLRRLWFVGLWLMWPWPMFVFNDAMVPAVRYVLLAGVALTMAVTQGAAGPVVLIVVLFVVMAAGTTLACGLLAWGIERLLRNLPDAAQRTITFGAFAIALVWAIAFGPYRTPFGRALTGGLLDVLS
jgi:hypothetical protein